MKLDITGNCYIKNLDFSVLFDKQTVLYHTEASEGKDR